ncbi:hypothetical protein B0H19DRAFT_1173822 [Mycena capillaripes]|nr:hypothetical protein B0H19DRAFT_1173822 [Mycena capillaripes]
MLSFWKLFLIAVVAWNVSGVVANNENPPALRLTPLRPRTGQPQPRTNTRRATVIEGLLTPRACPSGYGLCSTTGVCCPLGGDCCKDGHCCNAGDRCYGEGLCCTFGAEEGCDSLGCCPIGAQCCKGGSCCRGNENCVVIDGQLGCCPKGEVCGGISNPCKTAGYVPCANEDFCCPPGDTCYRDSENTPRCRNGAPPPPTTTPKPPTTAPKPPTTTPKPPTTTPKPPTTTNSDTESITGKTTTTGNSGTTTHSVPAGTAPTSVPTPSSGSKNVVIDVSSTTIIWTGNWVIIDSSCSSGSKAKSCSGDLNTDDFASSNMSFSFTGTSVYVSVASKNAAYAIEFNGETITYGGDTNSIPTPGNCTFGWSKTDLSVTGTHILNIYLHGPSDSFSKRDLESPWSVEIQNLVITQPDSSASSSGSLTRSVASGSTSTVSGPPSAGSAASAPVFSLTLLAILSIVLFYV